MKEHRLAQLFLGLFGPFVQAMRLCISEFFSTWVIQEVVLNSRKATIMCGNDSARWKDLSGGGTSDISGGAAGLERSFARSNTYHPHGGVDLDNRIYYLRLLEP